MLYVINKYLVIICDICEFIYMKMSYEILLSMAFHDLMYIVILTYLKMTIEWVYAHLQLHCILF